MTDAQILTPASIRASLSLASEVVGMQAILDSHEALRSKLAEVEAELQRIDNVMARRPALDKPTRAENIEHAINTARRATERVRELEADRADIIARRDQALDDLRQRWEAEIAARKLVEAKLTVAAAERDEALQLAEARATALADVLHATNAEGYKARADVAEAGLARVRKALDRWMREQAEYPVDSDNRAAAAAAAVRLCAKELRAALTPAAPEPLTAPRALRPHRFDCDECGRGIPVDEDGCCRGCGADARIVAPEPPKGDPR